MIRKPPSTPTPSSVPSAVGGGSLSSGGFSRPPRMVVRRAFLVGAAASAGSTATPAAATATVTRKLAVAGLNFPGSDDATRNATGEGWALSYSQVPLIGACDNLRAAFVNAHMIGAGNEAGDGRAATFAVVYEYPAGSGVMHPATWGGAMSVTVASGALSPFHDPLSVPGLTSATPGALIGVQTLWVGADDAYLNAYNHRPGPASRKLIGRNAAGPPPAVDATDRSAWTAGGDLLAPVLITAERAGEDVAEVYVGDSITVDQAHTPDAYGVAGFAQEADMARGALKLCDTGDPLIGQAAQFDIRAAVIAAIPERRINIHVNLGANDLGGASDAQAMLAELATLIGKLKAAAPGRSQLYPMTLSPRIDGGTPTGPQKRIAFNAGVRAGVAGADGFFEFGGWAESPNAQDSGLWGAVGSASKEGGDQVHPRWFDAGVRADLLAARRAWREAQAL